VRKEEQMKKGHVKLKEEDRKYLENLLSKGKLGVKKYRRALSLLELDRGKTYTELAATLEVSIQAVSGWAKGYNESGLKVLDDKPRSGRPLGISGEQRAKITALACSEAPAGYSQWSLRLLASKVVELEYCEQVSHTEIGKILKKTNSSHT
jgi:transposase